MNMRVSIVSSWQMNKKKLTTAAMIFLKTSLFARLSADVGSKRNSNSNVEA